MGEEEELQDLEMVNVPFDGDFEDYDDDKDGLIDFAEFYDTVTSNIPLKNPAKLGEVFNAADVNGKLSLTQTSLNTDRHTHTHIKMVFLTCERSS